jgi:hypothetical protein
MFPSAEVFGTQFEGSCQWKLAEEVGKAAGFSLAPCARALNRQIDLVFASEYFEHIEEPIEHLLEVLRVCKPKYLLLANSFGTTSIGHFDVYKHAGQRVDGKKMSRAFNKVLRASGYMQRKTKCWNGRPAYWLQTKTSE